MKKILILLVFVLALNIFYAQDIIDDIPDNDLESQLEALTGDAAKEYVSPITSPFGANMNSGWFQMAPRSKNLGLNISMKIVVMGTNFKDSEKSFDTTGKFRFTRSQAESIVNNGGYDDTHPLYNELVEEVMAHEYTVGIKGPTIIGSEDDNIQVHFGGDTLTVINPSTQLEEEYYVDEESVELPVHGLLDNLNMIPHFAPQLTLGTIMGTVFVVRWLPNVNINEEIGELTYWGVGFQHNPIVWMSDFVDFVIPIDVSFNFFMQQLEVGDIMKATAYAGGMNISKTLGLPTLSITPYAGVLLEKSNVEFGYTYQLDDSDAPVELSEQKVSFDIDGENQYRFILGAAAQLSLIQVSFDYNFSEYDSFSASLGLGFRF